MAFDDLPAKVRREFDNDPFKFLEFVEDPENVERMAELGLVNITGDDAEAEADVEDSQDAEAADDQSA